MGAYGAEMWRELLRAGEEIAMPLALYCSRRGDCESLATLCRVMRETGLGPVLLEAQELRVTQYMPEYIKVPSEDWDDPAKAHQRLPMKLHVFGDCKLQTLVAMCLARPVKDGCALASRSWADETMTFNGDHMPVYMASLSHAQQELLHAAIDLFDTLPAASNGGVGISRLFNAVVERLAWPGVVDAFADVKSGGLFSRASLANTDPEVVQRRADLVAHVVRYANPVAALALYEAGEPWPDAEQVRDSVFKALAERRTDGTSDLGAMVQFLREHHDLNHFDGARHDALLALCRKACGGSSAQVVGRCLEMLSVHLNLCAGLDDEVNHWCAPVVEVLVEPMRDLGAQTLAEGFREFLRQQPNKCRGLMERVLGSMCVPALDVLAPVLPEVMRSGFWQGTKPYGGWTVLADVQGWNATHGPARWQQTLRLLADLGLDPVGLHREFDSVPDEFAQQWERTTLLHLVAGGDCVGMLDRLAVLLDMGADPDAAVSDASLKPFVQRFADKTDVPRWEDLWRSYKARREAQAAVSQDFGLRDATP